MANEISARVMAAVPSTTNSSSCWKNWLRPMPWFSDPPSTIAPSQASRQPESLRVGPTSAHRCRI